ncbi:MAG: STAS domain-containing protein [Chloroflexi bacterium SZAS-1]|nr:STAS domain-containing protein [Chloroflexi bacterium SZAS-1]
MRQRLEWLLTIHHPDDDVRRRGANFVALALTMSVISSLLLVIWLSDGLIMSVVAAAITVAICIVGVFTARYGYVSAPAWTLIVVLIAVIVAAFVLSDDISNAPFFLLLPPIIAGLLLPPRQVALVLLLVALAYLGSVLALPAQTRASPVVRETLQDSSAMLVFVGLFSLLGAISARVWLRAAQHAQALAIQSAAQLEHMNTELEARVAARTQELERALVAQQVQAAELGTSLAQQQALNELINRLSLPLIPVRSDVLVAPLIGNLDDSRVQQLTSEVLRQIEQRHARAVILDITGVAVVDIQLAQALLTTADAARLLGAQTILVGIRPEVAQTLISLGGDLGRLRTGATLQDGLALVD